MQPLVEIEHAELLRHLASRFKALVEHQRLAEKVAERIAGLDRETQDALDELQRRIDVLREQRGVHPKPSIRSVGIADRVLMSLPGCLSDIALRSGDSKSSVAAALWRLTQKGLVVKTGEPGSYWYEMASNAEAA